MEWTFVYLMVFLKIPILLLGWVVWWAVHNVDELPAEEKPEGDDDGGIGRPDHPRGPKPRPARRGPHRGDPTPSSPARSRTPATPRRRSVR